MTAVRCATCAHWKRGLPLMSDAIRDPTCPPTMGGCTYAPPAMFQVAGHVHGFWPRTHEDDGCGEYLPRPTGDGPSGPDGGEPVVVSIDRRAA